MNQSVHQVPRSRLLEVYELVLARWPDVIVAGHKTFHLGDACNMRTLNELHFPIEDWANGTDFEPAVEEIVSTVEHYLFTAIHSALRNLVTLNKADLDFEAFASRFDGHPNFKVISDE